LDQVLGLDPKNAMAFNSRGLGYAARSDYDRAIGDLDQAIQLDPKNALAAARYLSTRVRPIEH
jgi:lipoprotein NlpI